MNKLLLLLLICGGVVFGGKLYIENRYKEELDKALNYARPYADMSYKDLTIGFDGSSSIHDISYRNPNGPGSFTIKKTTAISSDRFAPLKKDLFKNGTHPEWIKVSVNRVVIDSVLIEPDIKDECTSLETAFIYSEVGIKQIFSSASIALDFRDLNNASIDLHYEDQTSTLDLKLIYSLYKAQQFSTNFQTLPIQSVQLSSYLDPEFASLFIDYCANKLNTPKEKYLSEVVSSPKYLFDSFGYNFGNDVSKALATYMEGGHTASINSTPSDTLKKVQTSSSLPAQEIVRQLNLKVKLNGESVLVRSNTNNNFEEEAVKNEPLVIRAKKLKYQADSVSNIPNLIYKKVKIWRKNNKARIDGRITDYADGIAFIEIRRHGGKAIYEIKMQDIEKIEVLR